MSDDELLRRLDAALETIGEHGLVDRELCSKAAARIRELRDLLDECERALGAVIDATDALPKLVDLSDDLSKAVIKCLSALARLHAAQEKADESK